MRQIRQKPKHIETLLQVLIVSTALVLIGSIGCAMNRSCKNTFMSPNSTSERNAGSSVENKEKLEEFRQVGLTSAMGGGDPSSILTPAEASRFLIQATYGPTPTTIRELQRIGYEKWLEQQVSIPPTNVHLEYVKRKGPPGCDPCQAAHVNAVVESYWREVILGEDQLRQRMAFALSQIFVISTVTGTPRPEAYASYLDILNRHALGNFRDLLEAVTLSPSMGEYLSHLMNDKEDPKTGRTPDENFAREIMQLFSIGLWQLNPDGTRKQSTDGQDIPTYDLSDVMGLAKVMTGLGWGGGEPTEQRWQGATEPYYPYEQPMQFYPTHHSTSAKHFLGKHIPAARDSNGKKDLKIALDALFQHPNVAPFIGEQLIKRFVTSNPSKAYISRISSIFSDNGRGVRGDLATVVRGILLDPEARDPANISQPTWGKVREPVIRYANYLRAFQVREKNGIYPIWNTEDDLSGLAQNIFRAPSVFNWYRPNYSPPGTLSDNQLTAPEFQILNETTSLGYVNFLTSWQGIGKNTIGTGYAFHILEPDFSAEQALSNTPTLLVDRLNVILLAGQMSDKTKSRIATAIARVPTTAQDSSMLRVKLGILLTMASPEYIIQK